MPIRISLRRSCEACVKAKRRCDLQSPRCGRCTAKNISCGYANEPSTASAGPVTTASKIVVPVHRQHPPALWAARVSKPAGRHAPPAATHRRPAAAELHAFWKSVTHSLSNDEARPYAFAVDDRTDMGREQLLGPPKILTLDDATMRYVVAGLRSLPHSITQLGRSSFVQASLIGVMRVDTLMTRILDLCSLFATAESDAVREETREALLGRLDELDAHVALHKSLETLLLASQAMVMSCIVLYIGTSERPTSLRPAQAFQRQRHLNLLGGWAHRMWELAPWEMPAYLDKHSAWLFGESIRRTLLLSTVLRDVYNILDNGSFLFTGFVSVLPFDAETDVWDAPAGSMAVLPKPKLMSYRQLVEKFEMGAFEEDPGPFVRFLLVVCRGYSKTMDTLGHRKELDAPRIDDHAGYRGQWRPQPADWVRVL